LRCRSLLLSSLIIILIIPSISIPVSTPPRYHVGGGNDLNILEGASEEYFEVKPIGLVYSNLSNEKYSLEILSWNFLSIQPHIFSAGIPYEILEVSELLDYSKMKNYSCLIFVNSRYIRSEIRNQLIVNLMRYLNEGGSLLGFRWVGVVDENEYYNMSLIEKVFNIHIISDGPWEANYTITYGNLTQVNRGKKEGDPILNVTNWGYDFVGFFNYTYPHYVVSWILDDGVKTPAILASEIGKGRVATVTFDPYHPFVDNTPIVVYLIRWLVFGDKTQGFLLLSPGRVMPILALDADLTAIYSVANLSIRRALNLSRTLGLKFTWAFVTGPFNGIPDWEVLKPLIDEINSTGNEVASHSRTHPTWADYENDTDRVIYELKGSYDDLVGNLSMEIYAFHTPDGKFYEKWYPIASKYYKYIATIPIWTSHHVFGFYFLKNVSEDFVIFYRCSYSDYYYFEFNPIPLKDAASFECKNYDEFYEYGYSVPYIYLWHDYSFANDTRFYGMIEPTISHFMGYDDIYPSTLSELWRRMVAWRKVRFNLTYGQNSIEVHFDTSMVPKELLNYLSSMTFMFEGAPLSISEVYIDGRRYFAFSNDSIILPKFMNRRLNLTVIFGECETPHLSFTNLVIGSTSIEKKVMKVSLLNFFGGVHSNVIIDIPTKPKAVAINGSLYKNWVYDDGKLLLNLNTEGVISYDLEVCYDEPVILIIKTSHPIGKCENASIRGIMVARLEGIEVPLNLTLYLKRGFGETIKTYSYSTNITIVNGEFILKIRPPTEGWDEGIYSVSLKIIYGEGEFYTTSKDYVFSVCENPSFYSFERDLSFYSLLLAIFLLSYLGYKKRII